MTTTTEFVSVTQASKMLGVSYHSCWSAIAKGKTDALRVGAAFLLTSRNVGELKMYFDRTAKRKKKPNGIDAERSG